MQETQVIRAWRDMDYRATLTVGELAHLPDHPAGIIDLDSHQLEMIAAGVVTTECGGSLGCCGGLTEASCVVNCDNSCDNTCEYQSMCCIQPEVA